MTSTLRKDKDLETVVTNLSISLMDASKSFLELYRREAGIIEGTTITDDTDPVVIIRVPTTEQLSDREKKMYGDYIRGIIAEYGKIETARYDCGGELIFRNGKTPPNYELKNFPQEHEGFKVHYIKDTARVSYASE